MDSAADAPARVPASVLAIDAGQTGVKVRHRSPDGLVEWAEPGVRTDRPLLPQLADAIRGAAARGLSAEAVGIGTTGLTAPDFDAEPLIEAAAPLGTRSLILAHDSITAYLGALDEEPGVVVAAGTGVVTLAVGAVDVARIDGWGNIMGDAGSGYWIGRAALEAVMRAHDGRGEPTALTAVVREEFPELEDAYIVLQGDGERIRRVARYTRAVAELAERDAVAAGILDAAARELAHAAVTGLRRVGEDSATAPTVRAVGGVFGSERLATAFERAVRHEIPAAHIEIGSTDPLDGAARLVAMSPGNPLRAHVAAAAR
ncbi:BadF/BadG/BcrA/BcrD ATPase family protein [Agromyces mediolanus]|uniref:BadF/BadG/BcrA/BcrD ATPase family protein n=1 Tax=Agromyces mediolanus TaxID=41986 RepID=UPI0038376174